MSKAGYVQPVRMLQHSGVRINSYREYRNWGSVTNPFYEVLLWLIKWVFWFIVLHSIGRMAMASAVFSAAMLWFVLVRAFNYTGHGKGEAKHVEGVDFDRSNLAINQTRPGIFTGEWHNNHHLYPGSARAGFLPYQLDLAWIFIYCMHKVGVISSYHDPKKEFIRKYYQQ